MGNVDRAGDIIDRIREQVKKTPPRKEDFDLNAAIDEVIVLARSLIIRNDVSVQTRLADGLSPIHGDRVQLQQVILNLILNAVEAMGSVEAGARDLLKLNAIPLNGKQSVGKLGLDRDAIPVGHASRQHNHLINRRT